MERKEKKDKKEKKEKKARRASQSFDAGAFGDTSGIFGDEAGAFGGDAGAFGGDADAFDDSGAFGGGGAGAFGDTSGAFGGDAGAFGDTGAFADGGAFGDTSGAFGGDAGAFVGAGAFADGGAFGDAGAFGDGGAFAGPGVGGGFGGGFGEGARSAADAFAGGGDFGGEYAFAGGDAGFGGGGETFGGADAFGGAGAAASGAPHPDLLLAPGAQPVAWEGPVLRLIVAAAEGLAFNEASVDPFVVCRLGDQRCRTPEARGNANPVWQADNEFAFMLAEGVPQALEVEAVDAATGQSLGRVGPTDVAELGLQPGEPQEFAVPLEDGTGVVHLLALLQAPEGARVAAGERPDESGFFAYSPEELEYYEQLFHHVDVDGSGVVDGMAGAQFMMTSGVPEDLLSEIWQIADGDMAGAMGPEGWSAAMRLVAHAQAGRQPEPALIAVQPPALPDFAGYRRPRGPDEVSPPSSPLARPLGAAEEPFAPVEEPLQPWGEPTAPLEETPAPPLDQPPAWLEEPPMSQPPPEEDAFAAAALPPEPGGFTGEELSGAFEGLDADGDGQISIEEFEKVSGKKEKKEKKEKRRKSKEPADELGAADLAPALPPEPAPPEPAPPEPSRPRAVEPKAPVEVARGTRTLFVTVHSAYNLLGRNVGLMKYTGGLASSPDLKLEPYVVASIGDHKPHRTPPAVMSSDSNQQNPVWNAENCSTFYLGPLEHLLELEVFGFGAVGAPRKSFGKVLVDINGLRSGQWQRRRELLQDAELGGRADPASAELEFDLRLELLDFERAAREVRGVADAPARPAPDYRLQLQAVKDHMKAQRKADVEATAYVAQEIQELLNEHAEVVDECAQVEPFIALQEQERQMVLGRLKEVEVHILTLRREVDVAHGQRRSLDLGSAKLVGARNHFSAQRRFLEGIVRLEQQLLEAMTDVTDRIRKSNGDVEVDTSLLKKEQQQLRHQVRSEQEKAQEEVRRHSEAENRLGRLRREVLMAETEQRDARRRESYLRQMQQDGKANTWSPVVAGGGGGLAKVQGGKEWLASPQRGVAYSKPAGALSLGNRPDV